MNFRIVGVYYAHIHIRINQYQAKTLLVFFFIWNISMEILPKVYPTVITIHRLKAIGFRFPIKRCFDSGVNVHTIFHSIFELSYILSSVINGFGVGCLSKDELYVSDPSNERSGKKKYDKFSHVPIFILFPCSAFQIISNVLLETSLIAWNQAEKNVTLNLKIRKK